ncbi:TetR/AcrR family transcriptional regulator [Novosphingobium sp. AAP83]|uniref:TetR/AcrR family transcriptional regulator n=1 Tax=Novosphingobium sp. AAP83 TaxID=1523425 RepID=UPI0006B8B72C|nr:TetR/AcrR family transcriptional regulator [Novosphingobium sp. AAP83]
MATSHTAFLIAPAQLPKKRRAGRPTAARVAEIDRIILDAAQQLFLDEGVDATSMDRVSTAAAISKGTLYARYASKDALLGAVLDRLIKQMDERASATNDLLPVGLRPRLIEYVRRLGEQLGWSEYLQLNRLVASASKANPDIARLSSENALAGYVRTLATEMERAADHPRPEAVDWTALANLLIYGITGWYHNTVGRKTVEAADFSAYSETVVDAIIALIDRKRSALV